MIEITSEYVSAVREQEHLIASEKLGGNIVKEEFHKGALFGLKLAAQVLCAPKQEESPATGEHSGGPGTGNKQSEQFCACGGIADINLCTKCLSEAIVSAAQNNSRL